MTERSELIRAALGPGCEQFNFLLNDQTHTGWVTFAERGESLAPGPNALQLVGRHGEALRRAGVQLFVGGGGAYVGEDKLFEVDPVFALPGLDVLDIVEFAKTGSHNTPVWETWDEQQAAFRSIGMSSISEAMKTAGISEEQARSSYLRTAHGRTPWKIVRRALERFIVEFPFHIYHADEAGLSAAFETIPHGESARRVAAAILEVAPESSEAIEGRMEQLGLPAPMSVFMDQSHDPLASTAHYIQQTGGFSLWWD
ncbi:MAG TPA: hypothetical protein VGI81_28750 [Tepidisphaeraceae bacterium]|jgi:hypothetical protein